MEKIHWAPKVRQAKIWQLYQNDALGLVDEDLVREVGFDLLQRCRSVWQVSHRMVVCPRCGEPFTLAEDRKWKFRSEIQVCPTPDCGWEMTTQYWHETWRHQDLLGSAAMGAIETYMHDYPLAKSSEERMVCIDQVIHAFHISLKTGQLNRSFANNLIEGSHKQVIDLLDRLYEHPGGVDKTRWRDNVERMFRRRRGEDSSPQD